MGGGGEQSPQPPFWRSEAQLITAEHGSEDSKRQQARYELLDEDLSEKILSR